MLRMFMFRTGIFAIMIAFLVASGGGAVSTPAPHSPAPAVNTPPTQDPGAEMIAFAINSSDGSISKENGTLFEANDTAFVSGAMQIIDTSTPVAASKDLLGFFDVNSSTYALYGVPTEVSDLPSIGIVDYAGAAFVSVVDLSQRHDLAGAVAITANFSTARLQLELQTNSLQGATVGSAGVSIYVPSGSETLEIKDIAISQNSLVSDAHTQAEVSGFGATNQEFASPLIVDVEGTLVGPNAQAAVGAGLIEASNGIATVLFAAEKPE